MRLKSDHLLLEVAEAYLREWVAPRASEIDEQPECLRSALQGLGDRALLALQVPKQLQGQGLNPVDFARFQVIVARYSGALAFLQTQHQSAGAAIANSNNESLKQEFLPKLGTGSVLIGLGFSQLRRPGKPTIEAHPVEGGYELHGEVPWITGYGFFEHFIVGATLPTGEALYGLLPLQAGHQNFGGKLHFGAPMALAAMESTNTVRAKIEGWFLEQDRILAIKPRDRIHEQDRKNVLKQSFFALGCARAGLDRLEASYQQKHLPFLQDAYQALDRELNDCRTQIFAAVSAPTLNSNFEEKLSLRAWAINLAGRCSQSAVVAASGAANAKTNAAQRVYREALLFSVAAQTTAAMEATLAQLLRTEKS